ncbi:unnamed protein product [Blepharisma stoltei]|uniref:Zorya protein ZorC EH domain-containing protein n=1 Tax=Blepharisma stoltei TaxID=1481888 RepID=A0AAU9KAT6_9CILI|nr:unnamed protein product [Blepharisma stoltei]
MAIESIRQFIHILEKKDFIKEVTSISKKLQQNNRDSAAKQAWQNLLSNYKTYHQNYNKDADLFCTMTYWAKKLSTDDNKFWEIIDNQAPLIIDSLKGRPLGRLAYGISGREEPEKLVINHLIKNRDKLSFREISEIAKIIPKNELMELLVSKNPSFKVYSDQDLLFYVSSVTNIGILKSLESSFCELLPNINALDTFISILYEFFKKDILFEASTMNLLEQKILALLKNFEIKDLNNILKVLNSSQISGRLSSSFWDTLEKKIENSIEAFPVSSLINTCSWGLFFRPKLFETLINNWRSIIDRRRQRDFFREGFCSLALTPYFTEDLMTWSKYWILRMMKKFDGLDILSIMRTLVIINNYDTEIWNALTDKFSQESYKTLKRKEKSAAFYIALCLDIDKPSEYLQWNRKILEHIDDDYKVDRVVHESDENENKIHYFLNTHGTPAVKHLKINDIYTANIVIQSKKIIIEYLPAHLNISQHTSQLIPKSLQKIRHLRALKWHVIYISNMTNFEESLSQAISTLSSQRTPHFIHII